MILIGNGRIGGALWDTAKQNERPVRMVTRTSGWEVLDEPAGELIFVSVRTTDLEVVLPRIPAHRRTDVIITQNGMLSPWLAERDWQDATRGVLYFAVPKRGAPVDVGEPSPFCGPRAHEAAEWLEALGIDSKVVSTAQFESVEVEKLLWNCVFGLLCGATKQSVGVLCDDHDEDIRNMTAELIEVAAKSRGVVLDLHPVVENMMAYSRSIADYVGRVSDWEFRNGWFVQAAEEMGLQMPCHAQWNEQYLRTMAT